MIICIKKWKHSLILNYKVQTYDFEWGQEYEKVDQVIFRNTCNWKRDLHLNLLLTLLIGSFNSDPFTLIKIWHMVTVSVFMVSRPRFYYLTLIRIIFYKYHFNFWNWMIFTWNFLPIIFYRYRSERISLISMQNIQTL